MVRTKNKIPAQPNGLMGGHMPGEGHRIEYNPVDQRRYMNTVFFRD